MNGNSPPLGVFPVVAVYLTREERDRLIKAFAGWPNTATNVLVFRQPHEGQVQFILRDEEPADGNTEASKVDKNIIEQIKGELPEEGKDDE